MSKTTTPYWNVMAEENESEWEEIPGAEGQMWQLTLAMDEETGDYTRLTRFAAGANTRAAGVKKLDYPEEMYVLSGKLFDETVETWIEAGHYVSRPPFEPYGPFLCAEECVILEISYPGQARK